MSLRLRPAVHAQIKDAIERRGFFLATDFAIVTKSSDKESDDSVRLLITYLSNPTFFFNTKIPENKTDAKDGYGLDFDFSIYYSPGEVNDKETSRVRGFAQLIQKILEWVQRIQEDLAASPQARQLQEQRQLIDDMLKQIDENDSSDKFFTREEAQEWKQRLDDFEKMFNAHIAETATSKEEIKQKTDSLHKDMDTLKNQVDMMQKKGFLRSFMGRFASWLVDPKNRPLLQAGGQFIKGVLTDGKTADVTALPPAS